MKTKEEVLKALGKTDTEAKKLLQQGTDIFFDLEECLEEYINDFRENYGYEEDYLEAIRKMVDTKKPIPNGFWAVLQDEDKTYYVYYAL